MTEANVEYYVEPGQEVEVDFLRPEDAEGTAACFLAVYGKGYPIKTYLDPEALARENQAGRVISSVARTISSGQVVGHNAMYSSAPGSSIYESGAGVVLPAYRAGNLFTRMVAHGLREGAPRHGVKAAFGEPVCNHVFSQKLCRGQDMVTMAVETDLMPAEAYSKEKSAQGRVSALLEFITLEPLPHTIHLPRVYAEQLAWLYQGLDDQRDVGESDQAPPDDLDSRIDAQVFEFARVVRMAVQEIGNDFAARLAAEEEAAAQKGVEIFQVWLKLSCPWVGAAVDALRSRGYFLGGALPRWFDQDGLLMQKTTSPPHWDAIRLEYDRARKIVDMARADWQSLRG